MAASTAARSLLRNKAWIGGAWTASAKGTTFPVFNPCNGKKIAEVPDMGEKETDAAIGEAYKAKDTWGKSLAADRAKILKDFYHLVMEKKEEIASLVSLETGKPMVESRAEVAYGASFIEWFAEEARRVYGDVIPQPMHGQRIIVTRQPVGVAAMITPWNFPVTMILRKMSAALAAGCTCIIKPSEETPLSALALAELSDQASFPHGVMNVVTASRQNSSVVGKTLCSSDLVCKLSFTGSTRVGKILMSQCAETVKKVSMELGGNAPHIVFDSADIDLAVRGTMAAKFRNTGQACIGSNRILVQSGIYEEFVSAFSNSVSKLKLGHAFEEGVNQGPLINQSAMTKVKTLVDDAVSMGAKVRVGGGLDARLGDLFYQPSVLTGITSEMKMAHQEVFGPIAPIMKFNTEEEAVAIANHTPYGLAGYFFTSDMGQMWRVSGSLESGMVGINDSALSTAVAPFGGIKQSGIGREGSKYGIDEYLNMKYLCIGGINE